MTDPYVRDDVRAILAAIEAAGQPPLGSMSAAATRAMYQEMRGASDLDVGTLAVVRDFELAGGAGTIAARLFDARAERGPGPVIVYFHGGGFVVGDLDSHAALCGEMARAMDLPVVSVAYRLAPEDPFPAAPDDCEAAARWLVDHGTEIGREATGLILAGDSAGANLAIVTAIGLRDKAAAVPVVAQALFYPVTEPIRDEGSAHEFATGYMLTRTGMAWFEELYGAAGGDYRHEPLSVSQAGMPPTLVMTASLDPLRDQGRRYAAACADAGVETHYLEAAGTIHGFATMRRFMPSGQADVARFLGELNGMIGR